MDIEIVRKARTAGVLDSAMAGYLSSKKNPIDKKAWKKMKESLTVSMILAIARAQNVMEVDADWCEPWRITEKVLQNRKLKCDLRGRAKKIIVNYIALYKEDCCEHVGEQGS